jgi:hypothetical protein
MVPTKQRSTVGIGDDWGFVLYGSYVCDLETLKSWGILREGHSEFGWIVLQ